VAIRESPVEGMVMPCWCLNEAMTRTIAPSTAPSTKVPTPGLCARWKSELTSPTHELPDDH
jgi:hypothetical protein